jgi:hypothetical protein
MMEVARFQVPFDGNSIPIPPMYRGSRGWATIILMEEPEFEECSLGEKQPFEPAFLVRTKGWKFNREEANER